MAEAVNQFTRVVELPGANELQSHCEEHVPILQTDIDSAERIATLTLDRPERRNALSLELMEQLTCALSDIGRRSDVAAVILAARGTVFSSGHDLQELVDRSA